MSVVTTQQMVDRVCTLMEQKLRVGGKGLAAKVRKAGRRLPKQVRIAAEALVQAEEMTKSPRLMHRVDPELVAEAYDICVRHLGGADSKRSVGAFFAQAAVSITVTLIAVAVLMLIVVWWRGLL